MSNRLMTSENAYIYIDIIGAQRDKGEIDRAIREIDEALAVINPSTLDRAIFQGVTYDAALEDYTNMRRSLEQQRRECVDLRNRITGIVDHYVNLDREIRRRISEVIKGG